jgi:hypothetical protein
MVKMKGISMRKWIKNGFLFVLMMVFLVVFSSCNDTKTPEVIHGNDGREIILRVFDGVIQWQYQGDTHWFDLITVDEIMGQKGDDGQPGIDGQPGDSGVSVIQVYINSEGELIVLLSNDQTINAGNILPLIDIYRVVFRINRDSSVYEFFHVKSGESIDEPKTPINPGYLFEGWFIDQEKLEFPYLFEEDQNIEIVAKWREVPFTYEIHNEEVHITGYKTITPVYAVIPEIIDGYPVVEIGENAFRDFTQLQEIHLPNTIKYIRYGAFKDASNLYRVFIEDDSELLSIAGEAFYRVRNGFKIDFGSNSQLEDIGEYAFYYSEMYDIQLPNTLKTIGAYAFRFNYFDIIMIPDSVTSIGMYAFANNYDMLHIIMTKNSSLVEIGDYAFTQNTKMKSLFIPSSVTNVGTSILSNSIETVIFLMNNEIPATFHANWKSGHTMPIVYQAKDHNYEQDFIYVVSHLDEIHILGAMRNHPDGLEIPSEILGLPVTQIGRRAFELYSASFISLPDSVYLIDSFAFNRSTGLYQVRISQNSNLETIKTQAFSNSAITNLFIPSSVVTIEDYAFSWMVHGLSIYSSHPTVQPGFSSFWNFNGYPVVWNIKEIGLFEHLYYAIDQNDQVTILSGDFEIHSIIIPSQILDHNVTKISRGAFYGQILCHVVIPSSVVEIGEKAFSYSSIAIIYTSVLTKPILWNDLFKSEFSVIHYGINSYGTSEGFYYVRMNTDEIQIIGATMEVISGMIPHEIETRPVTIIAKNAFFNNKLLQSIAIPNSVLVIKNQAFAYTTNLSVLSFENDSNLETIEFSAFSHSGIENIHIPASVISIATYGFFNNLNLTSITFEANSSLTSIGSAAFYGAILVEEIIIPNQVVSIGSSAFSGMTSLQSITFMDDSKLESIGSSAFFNTAITSIVLPKSLKSIGSNAFSMIKFLESVTFEEGSMLESIGSFAFSDLPNLNRIVIPLSVVTIDLHGFSSNPNLTIYVKVYSRPSGWNITWYHAVKDVIWGYTGE